MLFFYPLTIGDDEVDDKRDYQKDVAIDPDNLDKEWRDHPALMLYYGEAKAQAQYELDIAKENLDYRIALADRAVRDEFDSEKKKPTEAAITNIITSRGEIYAARREVSEARRRLSLLTAAVEAFQHRKSALENLVRLFGMQYYAEPTGDILTRGAIDSMTETQVVNKIRASLNDSRRNTTTSVTHSDDSNNPNKGDI